MKKEITVKVNGWVSKGESIGKTLSNTCLKEDITDSIKQCLYTTQKEAINWEGGVCVYRTFTIKITLEAEDFETMAMSKKRKKALAVERSRASNLKNVKDNFGQDKKKHKPKKGR